MRIWLAILEAKGMGDGPRDSEQGVAVDEHGSGSAGSGPTSPTEGGTL
jgi:hypothetical protein